METANKYILKCLILTIVNISTLISVNAQDPQFSQFYSSPLYLAPSFAGTSGGGRIIINYRDQWPRLTSTFVTMALSADYYLEKYRSGVGLLLLRDDAGNGLMNNTRLGLNYSFNFNITEKWKFRPGLQAYYYWESIDYSFLRFGDQILRSSNGGSTPGSSIEMDNLLSTEPVSHIDFSTSLLAYSDQYWFGFTMDHLMFFSNTLANSNDYIPFRYAAFGGGKYHIKSKIIRRKEESITVAFNFFTQKKIKYLDLGTYYTHEPLLFGLWYRGLPVFPDNQNLGAITLLFGYKFKALRMCYSYDFTTSKLITQTGGAHEVSIIYTFSDRKRVRVKHKALPCPGI